MSGKFNVGWRQAGDSFFKKEDLDLEATTGAIMAYLRDNCIAGLALPSTSPFRPKSKHERAHGQINPCSEIVLVPITACSIGLEGGVEASATTPSSNGHHLEGWSDHPMSS